LVGILTSRCRVISGPRSHVNVWAILRGMVRKVRHSAVITEPREASKIGSTIGYR
jgi:hypothetical protein